MISCPVNAANDFEIMNKEGNTNYPRCIIQLINRKQTATDAVCSDSIKQILRETCRFNQEDLDRIERLVPILGRCHEMVHKIE